MLSVKLDGTCEARDGYWVAKVPKLGIFGYGDSCENARKRVDLIVDLVFDHWGEHGVLDERLRNAGVEFERKGQVHWNQERTLTIAAEFDRRAVAAGA